MSIRDANVVIIEVSKTVVRAGLGLHDLLKTPTVVRLFSFKSKKGASKARFLNRKSQLELV